MLLSMTGYGDARRQNEQLNVAVEVRSVNNRYLKITTRCPDTFAQFEGDVEKLVRGAVARGTVSVSIRADAIAGQNRYRIDERVLNEYWQQLSGVAKSIPAAGQIDIGSLLSLPDVICEQDRFRGDRGAAWPLVREALEEALAAMGEFRAVEGQSMLRDLQVNCEAVATQLSRVTELAPQVVSNYRDRLHERVTELLAETDAEIQSNDLIREVSIFSERCDVNEEITRLRSHLDQFLVFLQGETSLGRKLEFLSQEMFRETNTIGSKANNVAIAHCVVDMKASIEKMREVLQNVE